MKRLANYTDVELAAMGGHVGPSKPGERVSAGRKVVAVVKGIRLPRTNHLPKRRPLFALQRDPEK